MKSNYPAAIVKNLARSFCILYVLLGAGLAHAGTILYATGNNNGPGLFTINAATGAVAAVGSPSYTVDGGGLAYDALTSTLYATGTDETSYSAFFKFDTTTGAATKIAQIPHTYNISFGGLAFDSQASVLYATGSDGHQGTSLFTIDPVTGAIAHIGDAVMPFNSSTSPVDLYGLGYDPSTDTLYGTGFIQNDTRQSATDMPGSSLFTINRLTGIPTWIGYAGVQPGRSLAYGGIDYDPVSGNLYTIGSITAGSEGLYTYNRTTGHATLVSTLSPRIGADGGIAFITTHSNVADATSTFGLLTVSVLGLIALRRRFVCS